MLKAAAVITFALAAWNFISQPDIWAERKFLDNTHNLQQDNEQAKIMFSSAFNSVKAIGASWSSADKGHAVIYGIQAVVFAIGGIAVDRHQKSLAKSNQAAPSTE